MSRLPAARTRVVFDCNTLVQALAFDNSPAAACLRQVESGHVELFISKLTLAELRRVLNYPHILAISPNMTPVRIGAFLERLTFRATLIRRGIKHVIDYPRDPDDEPYLDLAACVGAEFLVTRDKDLLDLMTGHSTLCKQFRQRTHPLRIVDPAQFLNVIEHPSRSG